MPFFENMGLFWPLVIIAAIVFFIFLSQIADEILPVLGWIIAIIALIALVYFLTRETVPVIDFIAESVSSIGRWLSYTVGKSWILITIVLVLIMVVFFTPVTDFIVKSISIFGQCLFYILARPESWIAIVAIVLLVVF